MDQDWLSPGDSYAYLLISIRDHLDSFVLSTEMSTPLHIAKYLMVKKKEKRYVNVDFSSCFYI